MLRRKLLLMDANVLIDFCDADATVITLISKHVGQVHVPGPILTEEVEQLIDVDWTELAITSVEPSLEIAAVARDRGLARDCRSMTTCACSWRASTAGPA